MVLVNICVDSVFIISLFISAQIYIDRNFENFVSVQLYRNKRLIFTLVNGDK